MMASSKLFILLSKKNLRYLNFSESSDFRSVKRSPAVFRTLHLLAILQGDPPFKILKIRPCLKGEY